MGGALVREGPVTLPDAVCDFVIEGTVLYAIAEAGDEVLTLSMETGAELGRIVVPHAAGLDAFALQGIEKAGDKIYILGSHPANGGDHNTHRIGVFDLRSGQTETVYSFESSSFPDLVGLQWIEGDLWTFDYSSRHLMEVHAENGEFELVDGFEILDEDLPNAETASGGLRGFFFSRDHLILSSISGRDGESSLIHILDRL